MEVEAPVVEEVVVEAPEVDTSKVSLREQIETATRDVASRERDDQGRFARRAEAQLAETQARAETPAAVTTKPAATTETPAETPERPTLAPNAWSHAAKAAFAAADPVIKQEIAKREADIHKEFTKQDGERNFGRAMKQAIEPYMPLIQAQGGNPASAIQNFLETTRILATGAPETKAQLVRAMCQQFGVDIGQVTGQTQGGNSENPAQVAPEVRALYTELANLKAQVGGFRTYAESQALAPLQAQIEAFGKDPARPHFEAVRPDMAALLQAGRAQSLPDAYDMAVWARPDIRSSLIASQQQAEQAKRVADARAKADAARRASGSVVGSTGIGASQDPKAGQRSLREEILAAAAGSRI